MHLSYRQLPAAGRRTGTGGAPAAGHQAVPGSRAGTGSSLRPTRARGGRRRSLRGALSAAAAPPSASWPAGC